MAHKANGVQCCPCSDAQTVATAAVTNVTIDSQRCHCYLRRPPPSRTQTSLPSQNAYLATAVATAEIAVEPPSLTLTPTQPSLPHLSMPPQSLLPPSPPSTAPRIATEYVESNLQLLYMYGHASDGPRVKEEREKERKEKKKGCIIAASLKDLARQSSMDISFTQ